VYYDIIMTGFGGQGIQIISQIVATASIRKGLEITFLPSYGVEKRGGRTNVTLVISDEEIGAFITNQPVSVIAMDTIGLDEFQDQIIPGGLLVVNTSLVPEKNITRNDINILPVKCNDIAIEMGNARMANMIALGAFAGRIDFLDLSDLETAMQEVIPERLKHFIPDNLKAIKRGIELSSR